jgi:hypothetical protein
VLPESNGHVRTRLLDSLAAPCPVDFFAKCGSFDWMNAVVCFSQEKPASMLDAAVWRLQPYPSDIPGPDRGACSGA